MSVLRASPTRVLDDRDLPRVRALLARDPVSNVFVASRINAAGLDSWRLGAEVWGYSQGGELISLCFAGANLAPVCATSAAIEAFADRARKAGRRCSSLVGPAPDVLLTLVAALRPLGAGPGDPRGPAADGAAPPATYRSRSDGAPRVDQRDRDAFCRPPSRCSPRR